MNALGWSWGHRPTVVLTLLAVGLLAGAARAAPSFISFDSRLPNPEQPYVMTSGTVNYDETLLFQLLDLSFRPSNPSQLDIPSFNMDGNWEFASSFDVAYDAVIGIGLAPPFPVSGVGTAQVTGFAPGTGDVIFEQLEFQTELVSLELQGPGFMLRESPTLQSAGVTTVQDLCPACGAVVHPLRISSFFDVFTEVSRDGGATWTTANVAIHLEQTPEPAAAVLAAVGIGLLTLGRTRRAMAR